MPALSDYVTGTISLTNGSVDFTGTSTGWLLAGFKEGDTIIDISGATEYMGVVATISANGAGTLTKGWEGPTLVDVSYRMRFQPDGARVSAQARNLIELLGNGNVLALAGLSGSANQVPMFTGPGAMTLVPKTDLVSGVAYDVQVDVLADRAAYDGQAEGFSVLVADVGDGRAAVYAKASATSGDWSDPAYVTGPIGPLPEVTVGTVTTGNPGTSVIVTPTPTVDGVELDFTIPAGRGPVIEGDYNPATAYVLDDVVLYNGSSWIALDDTTGNTPPTLPTTSNAYWQLLARQGIDGAGTVNSVSEGVGISIDSTDPTDPVVSLEDMAEATIKGRAAGAGTGAPQDLTATQVRAIAGPRKATALYTANTLLTTAIPVSGSANTSSHGTEVATVSLAASSATAKIRIEFDAIATHETTDNGLCAILLVDAETTARRLNFVNPSAAGLAMPLRLVYEYVPGDTAVHTYRIRAGASSGSMRLNSSVGGGTIAATLTAEDAGEPP